MCIFDKLSLIFYLVNMIKYPDIITPTSVKRTVTRPLNTVNKEKEQYTFAPTWQ